MRETIQKYFRAWIDQDPDVLKEVLAGSVVCSECWGPEYHGLSQMLRWFADWNRKGRVLEWTVKRTVEQGRTIAAEWFFRCRYEGTEDGFDGVTVADFDGDGKIVRMSEFQSKAEHCFPYGE